MKPTSDSELVTEFQRRRAQARSWRTWGDRCITIFFIAFACRFAGISPALATFVCAGSAIAYLGLFYSSKGLIRCPQCNHDLNPTKDQAKGNNANEFPPDPSDCPSCGAALKNPSETQDAPPDSPLSELGAPLNPVSVRQRLIWGAIAGGKAAAFSLGAAVLAMYQLKGRPFIWQLIVFSAVYFFIAGVWKGKAADIFGRASKAAVGMPSDAPSIEAIQKIAILYIFGIVAVMLLR